MSRRRDILGCVGIVAATLAAYAPALMGGMIWDDTAHVTRADLATLHGLWRIWFELGATQQYYPALHSAFWLEHRLWGGAVLGYHLTNVVLHAAAACLLAFALRRLWGAASLAGAEWLAALLFALHPVCVESVAWISEQKNTLSTVFYLLAGLAFLRWREGTAIAAAGPDRHAARKAARPGLYALATILFVVALLTKSVTATLPAALLVALWWRRGKLGWRTDAVPLIPWFALGGFAGSLTAWVERHYVGAIGPAFDLSPVQRCLLAGRTFWFYLLKIAWPANLMFVYPRWTVDAGAWAQYAWPAAALAMMGALWMGRRRARGPLAAGLYFAGSLFPALGFFNVYPFLFSFVADHWQYLASLGVFAAAAAGLWMAMRTLSPGRRALGWPALGMILACEGFLTWRQAGLYGNPRRLYEATLDRNPGCWLVHGEYANILLRDNRVDDALVHYQAVLRLNPGNAQAHNDVGVILHRLGRMPEAIAEFERTLDLRPDAADAHTNLGNVYSDMGRYAVAIAEYQASLRLHPESEAGVRARLARAHFAAGVTLAQSGRLAEAEGEYRESLRVEPDLAQAHANLGGALANMNRLPEAVAELEIAARLEPADAAVQYNLGLALRTAGRTEEAETHFAEAARLGRKP